MGEEFDVLLLRNAAVEAVAVVGIENKGGIDTSFLELIDKDAGLVDGNQGILASTDDEHGRNAGMDVGSGAGHLGENGVVGFVGEKGPESIAGVPDKAGLGPLAAVAVEIEGAGQTDGGLDSDGDGWVLGELVAVAGDSHKRGEMGSRGVTGDTDAVGVEIVLGGVLAQVDEGGVAIVNLRGERGVLDPTVTNGGESHALGDGELGQADAAFLATSVPAAAVDVDDERERAVAGRHEEVEGLAGIGIDAGLGAIDIGEVEVMGAAGGQLGDSPLHEDLEVMRFLLGGLRGSLGRGSRVRNLLGGNRKGKQGTKPGNE